MRNESATRLFKSTRSVLRRMRDVVNCGKANLRFRKGVDADTATMTLEGVVASTLLKDRRSPKRPLTQVEFLRPAEHSNRLILDARLPPNDRTLG